MALVYTSYADVESRWIEGEVPATVAQVETLLEDAEDTVLGEFPDLDTRIARAEGTDTTTGPSVTRRRVRKVIARMVMRHLRNPGGIRSSQQGAGPYQDTVTYGGEEPGSLYMTDEDRAEIEGRKVGGAFTIDTMPLTATAPPPPDPWTEATYA